MRILKKKRGSLLIYLTFIVTTILIAGSLAVFQTSRSGANLSQEASDEDKLIYLAEKGLNYAFAEMRMAGYDWYTHEVDANGNLVALTSGPESAPVLGASIASADFDSTDNTYRPLGNDSIKVKTYKIDHGDGTKERWILVRATNGQKDLVLRARVDAESLYDYFFFFLSSHTFYSWFNVDGQGFGKIYVNGNIRFNGSAKFKDIALLSTNSTGVMYVNTYSKASPYRIDRDGRDKVIDGYTLLRTKSGEFGFKDGRYPSSDLNEWWGYVWPFQIFGGTPGAGGTPIFTFTDKTFPDLNDPITLKMPRTLYNADGTPANWTRRMYWGDLHGEGEAANEVPVKFVRFYYQDNDGKWKITADPEKAQYAQIFDGLDSSSLPELDNGKITYKWKDANGIIHEKKIPVKEDGSITYTYYYDSDKDGVVEEHTAVFDVNYEKSYWGDSRINDPRQYLQKGYYRGDKTYAWTGDYIWEETKEVNYLNTKYPNQAEAFKDWLQGSYLRNFDKDGKPTSENNTTLDLTGIIKEGNSGARDLAPIVLRTSFTKKAKEGGIWIGYDINCPEGVTNPNPDECTQGPLKIYVNGQEIYSSDNPSATLPDWIKEEEFITGSQPCTWCADKTSPHIDKAHTLTIDVAKLGESVDLDNTNGIIWVDLKELTDSQWHNKGLKIENAQVIPRDGGLTFVCPNSVFIKGDLNYQKDVPEDQQQWEPTAIITDSRIYVLSETFEPPTTPPAYSRPQEPNWFYYLKNKLGDDFWPSPEEWPSPDDNQATAQQKIQKLRQKYLAIELAIKQYYNNRTDKEFCDLDSSFDIHSDIDKFPDPTNFNSLKWKIHNSFYKAHHPIYGTKKKAMPLVDPDHSTIHIYASIVTPESDSGIVYVENWDFPGDEVGRVGYIEIKGMRPHVLGNYYNGHWSPSYSRADLRGVQYQRWPASGKSIAQKYNPDEYPPGDLPMGSIVLWHIEKDPNAFNKHKLD